MMEESRGPTPGNPTGTRPNAPSKPPECAELQTSVMSHILCRMNCSRLRAVRQRLEVWHEALRGGVGGAGARGVGGDHAQGFASVAEGDQRIDPAELRRGQVERAADDRRDDCRGLASQRPPGGSGEEAVCGGRRRGGARESAGAASQVSAQGRRRVRGAAGRAQLRRPAKGHARWSLRLLADRAVELGFIDSVSHETVRRVRKRTLSNRGAASVG